MRRHDEGLTDVYNRFNDPQEDATDIVRLRELHDAMDRAVLDAYGWEKIRPACEFMPEFEDEEEEEESGRPRKKKYRYRWPDEVRDEVLAVLLDVNRKRAPEEEHIETDNQTPKSSTREKKVKSKANASDSTDQIVMDLGDA
jgi:hypothetical protein